MARRGHRPSQASSNRPRFWGRHAVTAALANPNRTVRKIWGTREALAALDLPPVVPITYADAADLGRLGPADAPHQGLGAEGDPPAGRLLYTPAQPVEPLGEGTGETFGHVLDDDDARRIGG